MSLSTLSSPSRRRRVFPSPERGAPTHRMPRWLTAVALLTILAVFAVRAALVAWGDSITSDETTYLTHALHFWLTGDDLEMWELGTPRLPHLIYALPSLAALRWTGLPDADPSAMSKVAFEQFVLSAGSGVLVPARLAALGAGLALLLAVFWAVARSRGPAAGLIATGLVALVPEVLAHSAIASSDMAFTAVAFVAIGLMARYAEHPTPSRWWTLALVLGLAWATRHSALVLLILAAGVHAWCALRPAREPGGGPILDRLFGPVRASVGLGLVAFLVLWAGDGFGTIRLGDLSEKVMNLNVPSQVGPLDLSGVPVPTSALSVLKQARHQNQGHEAYFLGQYGTTGWPLYFPVAFLLKTPLGLIALMVLVAARLRPKDTLEWVCLAALALLWIMLIRNKVNIGIRYALLTFPLLAPLLARLFEPRMLRDRVWGPITIAATAALVWASVSCHPRYLSYFNEVGGGPGQGWLYLADSNIDWGQDFDRLVQTLHRLGIDEVTTDISSERRITDPRIFAVFNPSHDLQVPDVTPPNRRLYDANGTYLPVYTRYVAASVSRLLGLYSQNDLSWLRTRHVVARVGDSIFLFDMDTPADRPLFE